MVVTIHQPDFLPWLGFFDRLNKSDLFIVMDDVQFIRRGWHHRDKIKTPHGVKWLTVPVIKKGRYRQLIKDVEIDDSGNWQQKHLKLLRFTYAKAPNFNPVYGGIKHVYAKNYRFLIDLNLDLLQYCLELLKINTPLQFSSSFNIAAKGTERLVRLVKAAAGDAYLTGLGSEGYLDENSFTKQGFRLIWQKFEHPIYPQLYGAFEENLSVLDYLMMGDYSDF